MTGWGIFWGYLLCVCNLPCSRALTTGSWRQKYSPRIVYCIASLCGKKVGNPQAKPSKKLAWHLVIFALERQRFARLFFSQLNCSWLCFYTNWSFPRKSFFPRKERLSEQVLSGISLLLPLDIWSPPLKPHPWGRCTIFSTRHKNFRHWAHTTYWLAPCITPDWLDRKQTLNSPWDPRKYQKLLLLRPWRVRV